MRKIAGICIYILVVVCLSVQVHAQNLVPNPSFETRNSCPSGPGGISYSAGNNVYQYVANWIQPISTSTPDYFNRCSPLLNGVSVPRNFFGVMQPHTGDAYMGSYVVDENSNRGSYREYMAVNMLQPMVAGHQYAVSFYVSFAKFNSTPNGVPGSGYSTYNVVATDQMGIYFSQGAVNRSTYTGPYVVTPSVANPVGHYLTDTTWEKIQGIYTATGGEQWLMMGNFNSVSNYVNYRIYDPTDPKIHSYLFVDDVCVFDITASKNTTKRDTAICGSGWSVVLNGHAGGVKYKWSTGDTTAQIMVHAPGTYWVGTIGDCIYYIDTINIIPPTFGPLHLGNDTVVNCGDSIVLSANRAYKSYNWNTGAVTPSIAIKKAGVYILTITDTCGTQTDTVVVGNGASSKLEIGNDTAYCNVAQATLSANHDYLSYQWNTGAATKSITITQSGTYMLTVSDSCGSQSDTIDVVFNYTGMPTVSDTTFIVCQGKPSPVISTEGANITWYYHGASSNIQPTIATDMPHADTLSVTQKINGCESNQQQIIITVLPEPVLSPLSDAVLCKGDMVTIGKQQDGVSYLWNSGYDGCCINIDSPGIYKVQVSNQCGTVADSMHVTVVNCKECIWAPSAFTPNQDGRNDIFNIVGGCPMVRFHLAIADRWGQIVYESTDMKKGWDGNYLSQPMPIGTYFYIIEALPDIPAGKEINMKGDIILIR